MALHASAAPKPCRVGTALSKLWSLAGPVPGQKAALGAHLQVRKGFSWKVTLAPF